MAKNTIFNRQAEQVVFDLMQEQFPNISFILRGDNDKSSKSDIIANNPAYNVSVKYGKVSTLESRIDDKLVSNIDGILSIDGQTIDELTEDRLWTRNRKQATYFLPAMVAMVSEDFLTVRFYCREHKSTFRYSSKMYQSSNGRWYLNLYHIQGQYTQYSKKSGKWESEGVHHGE